MINTQKRLNLLGRMANDGLQLVFTAQFSEEVLEQTCARLEALALQKRLWAGTNLCIQRELIQNPLFAPIYRAMCDQGAGDDVAEAMLQAAENCQEQLTQYPEAQVLAAAALELRPALKFEYMKHYLPFVCYEEEEQAILNNLETFPVMEWESASCLTEHQRSMMSLPFLGLYLFNWQDNEREALELLEQNPPLQKILMLHYRRGALLFLDRKSLRDLKWLKEADVERFRQLMEAFENDTEDLEKFWTLWLENRAGRYDLDWLLDQPRPIPKERRLELFKSRLSYLNAIYTGRLHLDFEKVRQYQLPILIYAVEHKKKRFLDLVSQNNELFFSLGRYSLLFEDGFCERCNLNSLTAKNLRDSDSMERSKNFLSLLGEEQQYTFEELHLLWRQKECYVKLYTMLTPLSVDQRLVTFRQLAKRNLVDLFIQDECLEQLAQCLLQKPFSAWYQEEFGHIRDLTRQTAMGLLQHYSTLRLFIPELQIEADAVFALHNRSKLSGYQNWQQVRASILLEDEDWTYLREHMAFNDEFVGTYQTSIVDFLLRGGSAMVRPLYEELRYSSDGEKGCEALRRIVQAELMGKFYKLKYFAGDLRQELHYPIQAVQEEVWKQNLSLSRSEFEAEEVDDFYHTLQIGELPHRTCLSYRWGNQRNCLLAAFDSNKKIILVRQAGRVVARACLRLTKGSFQQPPELQFEFADLSREDRSSGDSANTEKLVLFLEHIYITGLDQSEEKLVKEMAVALTTQKAVKLGAVAVLAHPYCDCYPREQYISAPIYIYISKSKNGNQYLDSLGGAAVASAKEKYTRATFLIERTALGHAGAAEKKEGKTE